MASKLLALSLLCLFLLIVGDCVSTYLCLTTPSEAYQVWEYNPVSDWMFQAWGIIPGLVVFVTVKALGLVWLNHLAKASVRQHRVICIFTVVAILFTAYVNVNNWSVYALLKS